VAPQTFDGSVYMFGAPGRLLSFFTAITSVAELEPHHLVGAGAVTRCGSGSNNGIKLG
jgi:hypothetical protein